MRSHISSSVNKGDILVDSHTFSGRRIAVVGVSGSGKTTLAHTLAERLAIPHVELDALHWEPNWTPALPATFRERVTEALASDAWVVDGNYSTVRDLIWSRADTLIWLDYSFPTIYARLTRRTVARMIRREQLWGTNYERLSELFARDSIFVWAYTSRPRQRRDSPLLLASPEYAHLQVIHLFSPRATAHWLAQIDLTAMPAMLRYGKREQQ